MQPKEEQQGWLTFAQNSDTINYVKLAYLLALSVKATCKHNRFAVAVDEESQECITEKQRKVFDYIITVPKDKPFYNEWRALDVTPFKETFKVECDMIIPRSVDHWWDGCRLQDVVLTTQVRNYKGNVSNSRYYRKLFDDNSLVNAYNGYMYYRYSRASADFFHSANLVYENFDIFRDRVLIGCHYDTPDTDVVFGLVATQSETPCYIPLSYPTFTHMKGPINGWKPGMDWRDAVAWTLTDNFDLIVGGYAQQYPFHYYQKDFCTEELIERYEHRVFQST